MRVVPSYRHAGPTRRRLYGRWMMSAQDHGRAVWFRIHWPKGTRGLRLRMAWSLLRYGLWPTVATTEVLADWLVGRRLTVEMVYDDGHHDVIEPGGGL